MKSFVNVTLAALLALPVYAGVTTASATPLLRTVVCADGTTFTVGDQVTDDIVCAEHGGVMPKTPGYGSKIKSKSGTSAIPLKAKRMPTRTRS